MKCVKCGKSYKSGTRYCQHCGAVTAEGEMALALKDFAKATKTLAKESLRVGKMSLQEIKPDFDHAMEVFSKAADDITPSIKPAAEKTFNAATAALQLAAQSVKNAADELRKLNKSR